MAAQEVAQAETTASSASTTTSQEGTDNGTVMADEQEPTPEQSSATTAEGPSSEKLDDEASTPEKEELPVQSGPFIDLLGPTLLSLEMTSETTATLHESLTNDSLRGKKVIGLYFSADWCGPCR